MAAMKLEPLLDHADSEALGAAARRTLLVPIMAAGIAGGLAALGGAALAGTLASPQWPAGPATEFAAAIGSATIAALILGLILARIIAGVVVRPVEMILDQLETRSIDRFNWQQGRALGREALEADLKLLQRRLRQLRYQSKTLANELQLVREETHQQHLAKSRFLASMSHELRTPLNAILGYAMLLQEDASEAGNSLAIADLERIQLAGRNLLGLINNILDLSKIEAGRMDLRRAVIDPGVLAANVARDCGAHDRINGNRFELDIADGVGLMVGDAEKLGQCLANLLRNALKFTRDGVVRLSVAPAPAAEVPSLEFAVIDNGPGIDPELRERLFDSFEAGSSGRQGGSPGLGLTIVNRLAAMMGGECRVEGAPGRGSTFRLLVPLGDPLEPSDLSSGRAKEAQDRFLATPAADRTVLIVEDDAAALDLMQRWLARMGYNIVSTSRAEAALALAREHRPDLILLDALLPGQSGYELLEEICADAELGHIPTILITVDDDRARGLKAGAADYLRKPITEQELRSVIDVYRRPARGDILLIDDDDDSADLLRRSVAQAGFSARRAASGAEGLAMATAIKPQAIVLDLAMPAMNGFEVMARLAEEDALRAIPLIVVSGCDITIEDHRRLAAAGHRFFMKAACTPREIAQSLKELVA